MQDPCGRTACIPYASTQFCYTRQNHVPGDDLHKWQIPTNYVHLSIPTLAISSIQGCKPTYPLSTSNPLEDPKHTLFYGNFILCRLLFMISSSDGYSFPNTARNLYLTLEFLDLIKGFPDPWYHFLSFSDSLKDCKLVLCPYIF